MTQRAHDRLRGLGFLIADLNRLMRKAFDRRVRHLGLTRSQWLFIAYLAQRPGCTQSELAEMLQLEKITVSRQAERLVKAGWVSRRDHAADGRAYHLHLTPRARRLSERLEAVAADLRADYLRGFSAARRLALRDDLLRIKANLLRLEASGKNLSRHESN
jgi:DNA-binding MarR family transcriptional regulator